MSSIAQHEQPNAEGDILRTSADIGRALGLSPRAAYHLVASGTLRSIRKINGRYFASRSRLIAEVTGSD
jgi:hypothetical protein